MKNIPQFFEAIREIYRKANPTLQVDKNFILHQPTPTVLCKHYRFFLESPFLDQELFAILEEKNLCKDDIYLKDEKNFRMISEEALKNCSEEDGAEVVQKFLQFTDAYLSKWTPGIKQQLEDEFRAIRLLLPLRIEVNYACFPPELIYASSDSSVLHAVSAFLATNHITINEAKKSSLDKSIKYKAFTIYCPQRGLSLLVNLRKFMSALITTDEITVVKKSLQQLQEERLFLSKSISVMMERKQDPQEIVQFVQSVITTDPKQPAERSTNYNIPAISSLTNNKPILFFHKRGATMSEEVVAKKKIKHEEQPQSTSLPASLC